MFFASTLRSRTSNARRACFESLEGRRLLSGAIETEPAGPFAVWNLADSGPGSLRQAISDANDNPGAQTERRGVARPVRSLLRGKPHRPLFFFTSLRLAVSSSASCR